MRKLFQIPVITIAILAAVFISFRSPAQTYQFSQPTYLTVTTNSPLLATSVFGVTLPPLSLTITSTNANTIVTNTIFQTITYTNSITFIYNASTMGTNFSTNFNNGNPISMLVTNYTYGQAAPQSGGSNTCYIK